MQHTVGPYVTCSRTLPLLKLSNFCYVLKRTSSLITIDTIKSLRTNGPTAIISVSEVGKIGNFAYKLWHKFG